MPWRSTRVANRKAEQEGGGNSKVRPTHDQGKDADDAAEAMGRLSIAPAAGPSSRSLQASRWAPAQGPSEPQAATPSGPTTASPSRTAGRRTAKSSGSSVVSNATSSSPSKAGKTTAMDVSGLRQRDLSRPLGGKLDPMALLASPSRGLDATNLDGLLDGDITDLHVQVQFRDHISEQIRRHVSTFSDEAKADRDERQGSLSRLILLARKLREGLLAGSHCKAKADETQADASTGLFIDVSQLSIALSLLSEPPNIAQLQATLPRLLDVLSSESPPKLAEPVKNRLRADLSVLLDLPSSRSAQIIAVLADTSRNGFAHILSLQLLLGLHTSASRRDGSSGEIAPFGHAEYLSLRAELVEGAETASDGDAADAAPPLRQHAHIDFIHRLHHALLQRDVAGIRQIFLAAAAATAQDAEYNRKVAPPTFWQLRLLLSSNDNSSDAIHDGLFPHAKAANNHLVGTTSNATSAQTSAILDRFRGVVWTHLVKAYKPMGLPFPAALIPKSDTARQMLSPESWERLQASKDERKEEAATTSADEESSSASSWLERLLLLDDDFVRAFSTLRGARPPSPSPSPDASSPRTTLAQPPHRVRRWDAFLSQPARQLAAASAAGSRGGVAAADWLSRVEVRPDGTSAVLKLK
ncbi:hypothetical protein OC834_001532 [Tilletia horrida]|nr:hypothetical protein OC834_001532 [Tilletia horrida]